jgi:hypothetical protein
VLNPDRGGRTTIKIVACYAFSTQFRNLRPNLAQLVKCVVQLCVEHGDQVDHAAQPGIALTNRRDNHTSSTAGRTARVVLQVKAISYPAEQRSILGKCTSCCFLHGCLDSVPLNNRIVLREGLCTPEIIVWTTHQVASHWSGYSPRRCW